MPETTEARRSFLKTIAAGAAASTLVQSAKAAPTKGEQLRLGLIGCGVRMGQLLKAIKKVRDEGMAIEIVAISEVFDRYESEALDTIEKMTGKRPATYRDYQDLLALDTVDAVMLGTPDHWHAKQSIDALKAGKHVYCEKPMTHTIDEAFAVLDTWRSTGRVMQVGVQTTSIPAWNAARAMIDDGKLGKVLQYQTEYFRNSNTGQTRFRPLTEDMTPKSIDWKRWLGVDEGLLPDAPFDRAVFAHWRCYWPYGAGILTDLFVHRLTAMLKVTGLRYPGRVVCGGGIYLEYDERDTPDVTTVTVDYREGVQGILTATMCADATKIPQLVRGHFGSLVFPNGEDFGEFDFVPERPQVTLVRGVKEEHINVGAPPDRVAAARSQLLRGGDRRRSHEVQQHARHRRGGGRDDSNEQGQLPQRQSVRVRSRDAARVGGRWLVGPRMGKDVEGACRREARSRLACRRLRQHAAATRVHEARRPVD